MHPQAKAAARWWGAEIMSGNPKDAGDPALSDALNRIAATYPVPGVAQHDLFVHKLSQRMSHAIDDKIEKDCWDDTFLSKIHLMTDYHPDPVLTLALAEADIASALLPIKTIMQISRSQVVVRKEFATMEHVIWEDGHE